MEQPNINQILVLRDTLVVVLAFALLVDTPQEYYTIMSLVDLIEFIYGLNKNKMLNPDAWSRWKALSGTMMTIPKFRKVWNKTKDIHSTEFRDFIDTL